jgi:hypothetical protein
MKCRSWTTIFKLLLCLFLPVAAAAQTLRVTADIESARGIRGRTPETIRCNVRFTALPVNGSKWRIALLDGQWNEGRIHAENHNFDLKNPGSGAVAKALSMLLPYASEEFRDIRVPSESGPLDNALMHELLRKQGFDPEKMTLDGRWVRESATKAALRIQGKGTGQRIDYRMLLAPDSREVVFDYRILLKMPESDPFTAGLELESSGRGTITITIAR